MSHDYPWDRSVHHLFEAQVEQSPDAVAVVFEHQQLTYRQLNAQANQVGHYLAARGVGPEVLVGICAERSLEMIVGMLGILKAGGAYVPLDPIWPRERLTSMLADAQAPILLTQQRWAERLPAVSATVVALDSGGEVLRREPIENPAGTTRPEHLAYVIYTSGSTGRPKGVLITHRNLAYSTSARMVYYRERVASFLLLSSIAFDSSVAGIFWTLCQGGTLVLTREALLSEPAQLVAVIARERASSLLCLPSLYTLILEQPRPAQLSSLRTVIVAGEECPSELSRRHHLLLPRTALYNEYGPTEGTVWSTAYRCVPDRQETPVPIGRAIANTQIYLLDRQWEPVSIGMPGELYIGGAGVARGYLNCPDLTAERFIPDPFGQHPGARLYRTGDLARHRADGNLEFMGRTDQQVKIRGHRVELGEVEAALRQHPAVRAAVAAGAKTAADEQRLVAYFVPRARRVLPIGELQSFLRERLPEYMLPAAFMPLDALPLTPTGKVDRRALPLFDPAQSGSGKESVAPRDLLEFRLVKIWERVLGAQGIGVTDSFFDLGGHSLLAVRMVTQIEKAWSRSLPLGTLFQAPTVEKLAAILRQQGWPALWSSLVIIQPKGYRPPFFCVHGVGGTVLGYRDLGRHLAPDQPVYGLQAPGLDGNQTKPLRVEALAARYLEEVRSVQPRGLYCLGGQSFGGIVAFEMAQQLHAQGENAALLALFDTGGPGHPRWRPPVQRLCCHLEQFQRLGPKEKLTYARVRARAVAEVLERTVWGIALKRSRGFTHALPRALRNVAMVNLQAAQEYVPQVYPGRVTLFRSIEQPVGCFDDPHSGWSALAGGGLEIHEVPGDHITLMEEPHVRVLAEQLRACLQDAQREG